MIKLIEFLDKYMSRILMMSMIIFLFVKVHQANEQKFEYQMKMIEATEKYNEMTKDWSQCYVNMAKETHGKTICQNSLYDLREWLRECKCQCKKDRK